MKKRYTSDLIDLTFGYWTVLCKSDKKSNNGSVLWRCQCECGTICDVCESSLHLDKSTNCGCKRKAKNKLNATTHGLSETPLYKIWQGMKDRCYNHSHTSYENYGGRGIKMCDEWKNSFETFYSWAMNSGYEHGLTIERMNNNEGYAPTNCKWATNLEQANNKRNNHKITYNGKTMTIAQWSKFLGVTPGCITNRIARGDTETEAVSTSRRRRKR